VTELARRGSVDSPTSLETPSGLFVELTAPHPEDIQLDDVAHMLANECRFAGACARGYSVAEHAVLVARELRRRGADPVTVLRGLHHDDPEAYLKDIPKPLKRALEQLAPGAYGQLTGIFDAAIADALRLHPEYPDGSKRIGAAVEVKEVDEWALRVEAHFLLPSQGKGWIPEPLRDEEIEDAFSSMCGVFSSGIHALAKEQFIAEHDRCMADAKASVR
jgi:hypothetical protein